MTEPTKKQLDDVEEYAELQFLPDEIADLAGIDAELFDTDKAVRKAFDIGRLKAEAVVRNALLTLAKQGSSPAQKQFLELADKLREAITE